MTTPGVADATATAVLRFDASAVRPGVLEANGALQQLYGTVKDNWWGIRNLGEVFAGIGGIISAGLGGATAAAIGFEQSTQTIFKNVSDSATILPARMAEIRKGLQDLSETTPVALDNLVKIAQQGALYGIASDQVVGFTKKVADLTVGTNLTVADIGNLKKVMNEFNLPIDQIDRLGSALFTAEKNSSATAPAILNMTTQYGSLLHAIGATADEAVALSAVFVSQGARGQAAATATQNLFIKIGQAQRDNIPLYENYAKVAGLTSDEFTKMIATDPTEALVKIAGGLGKVQGNAGALAQVTEDLNQKNARSVTALLDLASASTTAGTGQKSLQQVIDATKKSYTDTTAYQAEVERQSKTTAAQITILKNDFQVLAQGIGATFLPAINGVVHVLQEVVLGFNAMPGPVKTTAEVLGAVTGGGLLFAGALLLIIPRLAQAAGAVGQLKNLMLEYQAVQASASAIAIANGDAEAFAAANSIRFGRSRKTAIDELIASEKAFQASLISTEAIELAKVGAQELDTLATEASAAADAAYAEREALLLQIQEARIAGNVALVASLEAQWAAGTLASEAAAAEALALQADAVAAAEAAVALEAEAAAVATAGLAAEAASPLAVAFGIALDFMLGPIGLVILGITALIAVIVGIAYYMGRNTKATDEYKNKNQELVTSFGALNASFEQVANKFILADKDMLNLIPVADALKISLVELFTVMRGEGTQAQNDEVFGKIKGGMDRGVQGAEQLNNKVLSLNNTIVESKRASDALAKASKEVGVSNDQQTASTLKLNDAVSKSNNASDVRARGELGLIDARRSLADADVKVQDAEEKLAEARDNLKNRSEALLTAEDNLKAAQISQRAAIESLAEAQKSLTTARADAAAKYQEDKDKLVTAQDQQRVNVLSLAAAQAAYNKLLAGPVLLDVIKATNALADARANLFRSTEHVADAEFQLQYLIGQGASHRDIVDAQEAITEAKNKQADETVKVTDAQTKLNEAQKATPAQLAEATLKVAQAQAALNKSNHDISTSTRQVHQDQLDLASDRAYRDAQDKVTTAQIALDNANLKVITSVKDLKKEQSGTAEARAYRDAQQGVIDALYNRAKAEVEVIKDKYEALTGQTFTAQQEVDALNGALQNEADKINGPIGDALRGYAETLKHLPSHLPDLQGPNLNAPGGPNQNLNTLHHNLTEFPNKHLGLMDKIFKFLSPSSIGGEILLYVANPIIGLPNFLYQHFRPQITGFFRDTWRIVGALFSSEVLPFIEGLPGRIARVMVNVGRTVGQALSSAMAGSITGIYDLINSLSDIINRTLISSANAAIRSIPFGLGPAQIPNIPKITYHAAGGVTTGPHLGMVGEAGPEAIIPLAQFASLFAPISALTAQLAAQASRGGDRATFGGRATGDEHNYYITAPTGDGKDIVDELAFFNFSRK